MAALSIRCGRLDPAASPAVLVGAWLIDALSGTARISLMCSGNELIMLEVTPLDRHDGVQADVARVLCEPRFAGWRILDE